MSGPTSSLPSMTVKLDDGTGTFPYDISAYVRWVEGLTWNRGRPDEFTAIQPGMLALTLDNTDGRFTFGNVTYNVTPDQMIRVANTANRWTGYVQSWPVSWPDGSDQFSEVAIEATDALARLARWAFDSATAEEIKQDAALYYRLNEPAGATQATDTMGNGTPLTIVNAGGTNPTFGTSLNNPDGSTGALFAAGGTENYLAGAPTGLFSTGTGGIHVEAAFNYTGTHAGLELCAIHADDGLNDGDLLFGVQAGIVFIATGGRGGVVENINVSSLTTNDGLPHIVSVDITSSALAMYYDSLLVYSDSTARTITWDASKFLRINKGQAGGGGSDTGTIAHVNVSKALSSTRTIAHQKAFKTDWAGGVGETPSSRYTRIAGYTSTTIGSLDTNGESAAETLLGYANQQSRFALDCISETADNTLGVAYIDASGALSSVTGLTIASGTTPDVTLDAQWVDVGTTVPVDMSNVINYSVGTSTMSSNVTTARNAVSIFGDGTAANPAHGEYRTDFQWNVTADLSTNHDRAASRTYWMVSNYAQPQPRIPTLTLDLLSMDSTNRANALTLDIGKYLRVTGMPSQTPGGTQLDLIVQNVTENVTDQAWTLTLNCTQKALLTGWVLGDSTWGVLGSTTKLYP